MTKPRLKTQVNENLNINIDEKFDYERTINYLSANGYARVSSCLLYTSPSPRDISGSRMPSSA